VVEKRDKRNRNSLPEAMVAMTGETRLVIELGRLNVRTQGPAIAGIWLETGGFEFPMVGWSDVVLGWWSAAILRLMRNNSATERVHFMDGPYAVGVSKTQSGKLQLRMFAGPGGGRAVAVGEADVRGFVSDLVTQSRKLLDECRLREWWSLDAEALASHLQDLDRELAPWR
jgi:hypothetical protein